MGRPLEPSRWHQRVVDGSAEPATRALIWDPGNEETMGALVVGPDGHVEDLEQGDRRRLRRRTRLRRGQQVTPLLQPAGAVVDRGRAPAGPDRDPDAASLPGRLADDVAQADPGDRQRAGEADLDPGGMVGSRVDYRAGRIVEVEKWRRDRAIRSASGCRLLVRTRASVATTLTPSASMRDRLEAQLALRQRDANAVHAAAIEAKVEDPVLGEEPEAGEPGGRDLDERRQGWDPA